jgi:hypothetical protein
MGAPMMAMEEEHVLIVLTSAPAPYGRRLKTNAGKTNSHPLPEKTYNHK